MNKLWGKMAMVLTVGVLLALFSAGPIPAQANTTTSWNVASGDWQVPGNWTAGVPDSATDAVIDNGGTVDSFSAAAEALNLTVGATQSGTIWSTIPSLIVQENMVVGDGANSRGTVLPSAISGDILVKGNLILGNQAGSRGSFGSESLTSFTLTVGQPSAPANMIVGRGGSGSFDVSDSNLTVHGNLVVGDQPGSSGFFNSIYFSTTSIAGDFILGNQGSGSSRLRVADITVGGDMVVGREGPGEMLTGSIAGLGFGLDLNVNGNLIIGDQATGSIGTVDNGDRFNIKGDLILGNKAGSSGSLGTSGIVTVGEEGAPANLIVGAGGEGRFGMGYEPPSILTVHGDLIAGDKAGSLGSVDLVGAHAQVKGDLVLGKKTGSSGDWLIDGGSLTVGEESAPSNMIVGAKGEGRFDQLAGTVTVHDRLILGQYPTGQGTYELGGDKLSAAEIVVGEKGQGTLDISSAAEVNVSRSLTFGENGHFSADPGATINMTGADFKNRSTNPSNLSGLENLTLVFAGGPATEDHFEVAGQDLGPVLAGFINNFALGTLQLGDDTNTGYLGLFDAFDNSSGEKGDEALYVFALILGAGSVLDLHELPLYTQSFTNLGGTILNGGIHVVPWPPSVLLLGSGLLGLAAWARRKKLLG